MRRAVLCERKPNADGEFAPDTGIPRCCTDEPQMREYEQDPDNAYILVRIFQVERANPFIRLFPDPWALKLNNQLHFGKRRSDGSHPVYIR